jgi:hypothetical protein
MPSGKKTLPSHNTEYDTSRYALSQSIIYKFRAAATDATTNIIPLLLLFLLLFLVLLLLLLCQR